MTTKVDGRQPQMLLLLGFGGDCVGVSVGCGDGGGDGGAKTGPRVRVGRAVRSLQDEVVDVLDDSSLVGAHGGQTLGGRSWHESFEEG